MKKNLLCLFMFAGSVWLHAQQNQASIDAPNIDFSQRFEGWKREVVYFKHLPKQDPTNTEELDRYAFRYETMADNDDRIKIMGTNATYDDVVACSGMLPINPDPGKVVARIGVPMTTEAYVDGSYCHERPAEAQGERLSYTYYVTENTNILFLRYAAVLFLPPETDPNHPNHTGEERPTFKVNVDIIDTNTGLAYTPPCKTFQTITDETSNVLISLKDMDYCGSTHARGNYHNYQYLPWTTSVVDLRGHEGRQVTLSVEVHDCLVRCSEDVIVPGGHEAYGYFRAEATSYKLQAMACNGNDLELIAPEGYARYVWRSSLGDAPVVRDASQPHRAYLDPTRMQIGATYYCDMYDDMECAQITIEAQVDPVQLTPNFGYENFCSGKVQFTDFSTAVGDQVVGWLWDFGDGQKSNMQHPEHVYSEPGEYTVTLTVTSSKGCSETLQGLANVRYFPHLKIQSEPFVCAGQDIHLSVLNVVEAGSDIVWTDARGVELGSNASVTITARSGETEVTSNTYKVEVTDVNGCKYTDERMVNVFKGSDIYIDGPARVCPGAEAKLEVKGTALSDIKWNTVEQHTNAVITVFPSQYTLYKVEGKDNNGCEAKAEFAVNPYPVPTLQINAPSAVCIGDIAHVQLSGGNGYLWHNLPATADKFAAIQDLSIDAKTTYVVTAYSEENCSATTYFTIDVLQSPVVQIDPVAPYCFDDAPFQLVAHGADTYTWNGTTEGQTFTVPTDRVVHATVVGKENGCASEPVSIELTPKERPTITANTLYAAICEGDEAVLSVSGAAEHKWLFNGQLSDEIHVSPSEPTTYYVTGISADGCYSDTLAIEVEVRYADQVDLHVDKLIVCPNQPDSVVLIASGALSYKWHSEPAIASLEQISSDRVQLSYDEDTKIFVTGTNQDACSSQTFIELTVQPEPVFEFSVTPDYVEMGSSSVHVKGITPHVDTQWYWNMGDGSDVMLSRDTVYHYDIDHFAQPFQVNVTAIDANGCLFEGSKEVKIWKDVWFPTAFSPNGDGLNDVFSFLGANDVDDFEYYVYNRLGELVFYSNNRYEGWDGTYNGKMCPWGVYGWVANYKTTMNGEVREGTLRGQVSIVK